MCRIVISLIASLGVALTLGLAGCSNPHTPAGHEGYVFEDPRLVGEGGFRGVVRGPGNYGVSPFRNRIVNIDTRPTTYTEQFSILVKDDLNVAFDVHAVMKVEQGQVRSVVEQFGGPHWYERFVKEPFRTIVRESVQQYASRELKAERENIASAMETALNAYLESRPFEVVRLAVGNIDYPPIVSQAVEKKLAARQLLEEKETQREIAQRDAQIRVEEAKGIAEAQKIINATLTANYLQHEAIEAQRMMANAPNHTTVYIPVGPNGLPLVHTP
ncbi:MAG: SPFH domain-containing protein [Polyangiales bacterium]|jgi:regulator of protease activity HflC (stomatin/prohibitin superfamily)